MAEKQEDLEHEEDLENTPSGEEGEEYTETQRKAMERGWDPNFEGDDNKRAISAEEFLDRQQLYDDLRKRGRDNKRLQKAVDELRESHKIVAQQAYKRARRELEKEKREAYEDGDTNRALEIDKEMHDLDEDQKKVTSSDDSQVDQQEYAEVFEQFKQENPWYDKDPELRGYADMIGSGMINMNPEKAQSDPENFFAEVAAEVRRRFPDKFKNDSRKRGNSGAAVEGDRGGSGNRGGKKRTLKDLPEEHRTVAQRIVETGVMTEEEYVKDYFGES